MPLLVPLLRFLLGLSLGTLGGGAGMLAAPIFLIAVACFMLIER